jgi:hypothetical protein
MGTPGRHGYPRCLACAFLRGVAEAASSWKNQNEKDVLHRAFAIVLLLLVLVGGLVIALWGSQFAATDVASFITEVRVECMGALRRKASMSHPESKALPAEHAA